MDVPTYDIKRIFRLKASLMSELFYGRYYCTIEGDEFEDLVSRLRQLLPSGVNYDAVFETARQLAGVEVTPVLCEQFCWRVAGNIHRLNAGHAVYPWTAQLVDEWLPVQVMRAAPYYRLSTNTHGYNIDLRVLAGSAAPMKLRQFWSSTKCFSVSRKIGFSAPWGKRPYHDGAQLVRLRFVGQAMAAKSRDEPYLDALAFPTYCLTHNKDVLKRRFKIIPCPRGFGSRECHLCAVGYNECLAATHRETYVERLCPKCEEVKFFDPESDSLVCVYCARVVTTK